MIGIAVASLAIFPFSTLIGQQLQLPYLQTNMWNVLALIAVSFVFAVLTGLLASRGDGGETFRSRNLSDFERR